MANRHNLSPVKQNAADEFLLLMISSFGITVILVRVFLELTGYPQIGDSTFHIAHLLWGGLLLIIALGAVLIFANHWAYYLASLCGGIGTGLFIDEIGKFITQSNDYFYPLAFPIIYAFAVISVWIYLRVRRTAMRDSRMLLYHSFENLKEVLDNDLDAPELCELTQDLNIVIATATDKSQRNLAAALLTFANERESQASGTPTWLDRFVTGARTIALSMPPRALFKIILILGFFALAIGAFLKFFGLFVLSSEGAPYLRHALSQFVIVNGKAEYVVSNANFLLLDLAGIGGIGIASVIAAVIFARRDERLGLRIGTAALVVGLTFVNLLTFYFSQLYAIVDAFGQLILIGLAQLYRWRFFINPINEMATLAQNRDASAV